MVESTLLAATAASVVLTAIGLSVAAASWVSGRPPGRVAALVAVPALAGVALVVVGTAGWLWTAWHARWIGPYLPFTMVVPAGYDGPVALEFCAERPAGVPPRLVVPATGIVELGGALPDWSGRRVLDVVRDDGTPAMGTVNQRSSVPTGCDWVVFLVADADPLLLQTAVADPADVASRARAEGVSYAEADRRLRAEGR